jgi:predicted ArsR family transcriptional regulator
MGKAARSAKVHEDDIRMRILRFIKQRGSATLRESAKHLRVSHEGVRKQVALMEANGWIARSGPPAAPHRPKGRPTDSYTVTTAGDRLFPKAYDRLSSDIILALASTGDPEVLRKVLAALADMQVKAWQPLLADRPAKERLEALKGLYLKDDPFMSVEEKDGDLVLIERNCPFLNVAMEHPALCSLSVSVLERLIGHPVVREERFQAGAGRCVFRVRLGERPSIRTFEFEAGKGA